MNDLQRLRRLRRTVEARVRSLDIPRPFDVSVLCARLGARRGREIRLRPQRMGAGPCGLWADVAGVDYIVYEAETTQLHQDQIILHEVGHLLAAHPSEPLMEQDCLALLMPDLDPAMVRRVLGRHGYSSEQEQEAELLASLVLERAGRTRVRAHRAQTPEVTRALDHLGSVLDTDEPR